GGMTVTPAGGGQPGDESRRGLSSYLEMSSSGLSKHGLTRLQDLMARHVEGGAVPGLVSVVSRRGEAHVDVIGATAVEGDRPVRRDTIFRISSMTKPVTAVATMILLEECVVRL